MWHKHQKIILAHLNVRKCWLASPFLFDLIVFYSDSTDPHKELSFLWVYHMCYFLHAELSHRIYF